MKFKTVFSSVVSTLKVIRQEYSYIYIVKVMMREREFSSVSFEPKTCLFMNIFGIAIFILYSLLLEFYFMNVFHYTF